MKLLRIILCSAALSGIVQAQTSADADAAWAKAEAVQKTEFPRTEKVGERSVITPEFIRALEARGQAIADTWMAFVEGYPADPRRWDAIIALAKNGRMVIKEFGDVRTHGWDVITRDAKAEQAWAERVNRLIEELINAPGVPSEKRQKGYEFWCSAVRSDEPDGLGELRRRLDVLRERYPQSTYLGTGEWRYLNRLRKADVAAAKPWLLQVAAWPQTDVAAWAKGELALEKLRETPMELRFTAVDGRQVDLAALRGKVVLIDFWATWCGPCIAELPTVKKVHAAYQEKGFEVVAISLDRAEDRQKLIDFCAKEQLPWPQHFDGKHGKNEIAVAYGVRAIPSMFLLDQTGRLVATDARGSKLEQDVKRLLKL